MLKKSFFVLTIVAAIAGSALLPATASAKSAVVIRFFDRDHHDYHRWDRAEDARYRAYLHERHERYLAFRRASRERQTAYWRWRHEREVR
jgi:hypothetical protein